MFASMTFRTDVMRRSALDGFANATDCADYLVRRGVAFRDAHRIVGELVAYCLDAGKTLEELTPDEYRRFDSAFGEDVYGAISLETCVGARSIPGGPAPQAVAAAIASAEKKLAAL